MANQTAVNKSMANGHTSVHIRRDLGELSHDLLTLAELQARLLGTDAKESARFARIPAAAMLVSLLLGIAALPAVLIACGTLLAEQSSLGLGGALMMVSLGAMAVAVLCAWVGYRSFLRVLKPLERSRDEFEENIRWIKSVLRHPRSEPAPQPVRAWPD